MTSLVAWVGVDQRSPASIYVASDSRLSWPNNPSAMRPPPWDRCRKVHASRVRPELVAYQGFVELPALLLSQLVELHEARSPGRIDDAAAAWAEYRAAIRTAVAEYPWQQRFSVLYCARENEGMDSRFRAFLCDWEASSMTDRELNVPDRSGAIVALGSGGNSVKKWIDRWGKTSQGGTSRAVFGAFCDSLTSGEDPGTGGAPQLAGVYRVGPARHIGVVYEGQPYLMGVPVKQAFSTIEWRNTLFERCDPGTLQRLSDAQAHGRPRGLGRE